MREDQEFREFRDLMARPTLFEDGFSWRTVVMALFVGLVAMFVVAVGRVPISLRVALTGMLAAVFPFGPFWFDRRLAGVAMESPQEADTAETNGRL